jgi:hypothetical protein
MQGAIPETQKGLQYSKEGRTNEFGEAGNALHGSIVVTRMQSIYKQIEAVIGPEK